ncbi:hypothetical protein [Ruegeria jejuensis]|uniref:hypothetical protein n=1 Tax=Ruegeria jejuensis TaxID=3233338 RepID=UPI00355BE491
MIWFDRFRSGVELIGLLGAAITGVAATFWLFYSLTACPNFYLQGPWELETAVGRSNIDAVDPNETSQFALSMFQTCSRQSGELRIFGGGTKEEFKGEPTKGPDRTTLTLELIKRERGKVWFSFEEQFSSRLGHGQLEFTYNKKNNTFEGSFLSTIGETTGSAILRQRRR